MAPSLKPLASDLIATIDEYKDPSGQSGFLLRKKIIGLANQIISEVEEPEELTWKYSVYVLDSEISEVTLLIRADGRNGRLTPAHGLASSRPYTGKRKHHLYRARCKN